MIDALWVGAIGDISTHRKLCITCQDNEYCIEGVRLSDRIKEIENGVSDTLQIWMNGCDYLIASSLEDAMLVHSESTGESLEDVAEYWSDNDELKTWPDDKPFTFVYMEDDEYRGSPERREKRTAAEWVALRGRGYFACSEY